MRYLIVIEKTEQNYSAYVPDLSGCVATGDSLAKVQQSIREAIELHLDGMRDDGVPIPAPSSQAEEVRAPSVQYVVITEEGPTAYGAHVPDLPGCIAVGESRDELLKHIREAIEFHLEGLREDGLPIPEPSSDVAVVDVKAA